MPDVVPESVVLILPNETPAAEHTTDDSTWQAQHTIGEVVLTPFPTLVGDHAALLGDHAPLAFAAERTDGTALTNRLVMDYVAAAAGAARATAPGSDVLPPAVPSR